MAILKARENSSDSFKPVSMVGVGNASQSQRGLMTAQDKVKVDSIGSAPSGESDTLWNKVGTLDNKLTNLAEYKGDESVYLVGKWFGFNLYRMQFVVSITGAGVIANKEIGDFDYFWVDTAATFFKRAQFYLPVGYNGAQVYGQEDTNGVKKITVINENYSSPCTWYVSVYLAKLN